MLPGVLSGALWEALWGAPRGALLNALRNTEEYSGTGTEWGQRRSYSASELESSRGIAREKERGAETCGPGKAPPAVKDRQQPRLVSSQGSPAMLLSTMPDGS